MQRPVSSNTGTPPGSVEKPGSQKSAMERFSRTRRSLSLIHIFGQRFHDQHFHVLGGAGRDGAQAHGEEGLAQIRFKAAAGEVFAEAGFDQRFAQGRTGQAEENVLQHFQHEEFARVGGFARQPVEGYMPLVAVFAGGIGEFKLAAVSYTHLMIINRLPE